MTTALVLSIYAAVLSTILAGVKLWEFFVRDRPQLKVQARFDMLGFGSAHEQNGLFLLIEIVNTGRRPVTPEMVALKLRDGREAVTTDPAFPEQRLPKQLTEGQAHLIAYRQGTLEQTLDPTEVVAVLVRDQSGKVWQGKARRTQKER